MSGHPEYVPDASISGRLLDLCSSRGIKEFTGDNAYGAEMQHLFEQCDIKNNLLPVVLSPWEALFGGYLLPIFWAVIIGAIYLNYKSALLALLASIIPTFFMVAFIPQAVWTTLGLIIVAIIGIGIYQMIHARMEDH